MRRAALLLLLAACDGEDSLGQLGVTVDAQQHLDATSCVLSTAASRHRPHGLYVYAEFPQATLEMDIDEGGQVDPTRVVYRELDAAGAETYHSHTVIGQVVLLGPPQERRGDFQLELRDLGGQARKLVGSFAPIGKLLPPEDPNAGADNGSSDYSQAIDTGCQAASDTADSGGCDGSSSPDTSSSGCDSGGGSGSGCDSGGGSSASGCSGDSGGGCSGNAHAATMTHVHVRRFAPLRVVSWLFPYALVGVIVRAWRRRLTLREKH